MKNPLRVIAALPALFRDFERVQGARRVKVSRGAVDTGEVIFIR